MEGKVPVGLFTTVWPVFYSSVDAVCACHGQTSLQSALSHSYFDVQLIERKTVDQKDKQMDNTLYRQTNIHILQKKVYFISEQGLLLCSTFLRYNIHIYNVLRCV